MYKIQGFHKFILWGLLDYDSMLSGRTAGTWCIHLPRKHGSQLWVLLGPVVGALISMSVND
jgi:hypothetical protein